MPPRNCLDEARVGRRVFQDLADLVDRRREAVVEVDEGVVRPETLLQFARAQVQLKDAEVDDPGTAGIDSSSDSLIPPPGSR